MAIAIETLQFTILASDCPTSGKISLKYKGTRPLRFIPKKNLKAIKQYFCKNAAF
jgi:hypothetical protein